MRLGPETFFERCRVCALVLIVAALFGVLVFVSDPEPEPAALEATPERVRTEWCNFACIDYGGFEEIVEYRASGFNCHCVDFGFWIPNFTESLEVSPIE